MDDLNSFPENIQKKIRSMPEKAEIIELCPFEQKMEFLANHLAAMTNIKKNDENSLKKWQEIAKRRESEVKEMKKEITKLENTYNSSLISLEKINKTIRIQKFQLNINKEKEIPFVVNDNDIQDIEDEIQQIEQEIQAYGNYTIAITPEIEEKKQLILLVKKENKQLMKEIELLLDEERKCTLEVNKIIEKINTQEHESRDFLNKVEDKFSKMKNNELSDHQISPNEEDMGKTTIFMHRDNDDNSKELQGQLSL